MPVGFGVGDGVGLEDGGDVGAEVGFGVGGVGAGVGAQEMLHIQLQVMETETFPHSPQSQPCSPSSVSSTELPLQSQKPERHFPSGFSQGPSPPLREPSFLQSFVPR